MESRQVTSLFDKVGLCCQVVGKYKKVNYLFIYFFEGVGEGVKKKKSLSHSKLPASLIIPKLNGGKNESERKKSTWKQPDKSIISLMCD